MFQDNISLIYALFMGIMLSSFYLLIVGKLSIKAISRIADVPRRRLYPIVLVLCVFGAYAVNNTIFDVGIMFLMGGIGFVMLKLAVPAAPFLIAFILGPLLEDNFRQSLLISKGSYGIFFSSGICWFFWALTLFSVAFLTWQHLRPKATEAFNG